MKTAIVTGGSSGIGKSICEMLIKNDFYVYAFGREFVDMNDSEKIKCIKLDLCDTEMLIKKIKIISKDKSIDLLVNNAGVGYFAPHEELNYHKIHEMVMVNVEVPMLLSQLLLRNLKETKGTIINISSVTAKKTNTHGCAYGATKAALTNFTNSLFEETRKYGVKSVVIHPDMTCSNFYRNSNFGVGDTEDTFIYTNEIADAVSWIISRRDGFVVNEMTIRPQKHQINRK